MGVYTQMLAARGLTAAQVLLTQEDLADRDRAICLRTTLLRLLELGAVPVLNENDSVATDVEQELLRHCRQTLPRHKIPAAINLVAGLGVNGAGKLVRRDA